MTCRRAPAAFLLGLSLASGLAGLGGCSTTGTSTSTTTAAAAAPAPAPALAPAPATPVTAPELSKEVVHLSSNGSTYFGGFPTEQGLRELRARGVTRIISLKSVEDVRKAKGYDEEAVAKELGIELVVIPVSVKSFRAADVDRFRAAYESSDAPVLIHCGSSNTVGGMWAAYLARVRGMPVGDAMAAGRAAGLNAPEMIRATEEVIAAPAKPAT